MVKIGYIRVSTGDQNTDLQMDALKAARCDEIFIEEGVSGSIPPSQRPAFREASEHLEPGDVFTVWKLDRLGRSLPDLINLLTEFEEREVEFQSLTDGIDTTTPGGKLVFHIMGALAEFERSLISERTREGLKSARRRGKRLGRPEALNQEQIDLAIREIENNRNTIRGMAEVLGVDRGTLSKAIKARQAEKA